MKHENVAFIENNVYSKRKAGQEMIKSNKSLKQVVKIFSMNKVGICLFGFAFAGVINVREETTVFQGLTEAGDCDTLD